MKKKKKVKELVYTKIEKVSRWNLCQLIASKLYSSILSDKEIEKIAKEESVFNYLDL